MKKFGVITEKLDNYAMVMVGNSATCGNCGCSALTRKNGKIEDSNHQFVKVKNTINAEIGDPVNIEFQTTKMLKTSAMLYLLPLVMLIVGIVFGHTIQGNTPNDILSFVSGMVFLVFSFIVISKFDKKNNKDDLITISEFRGM